MLRSSEIQPFVRSGSTLGVQPSPWLRCQCSGAAPLATDAGVAAIVADCGGLLTCATCHVYVDPAWADKLPPVTEDEAAMLEMTASPRQANSRLSCQIVMQSALDGLTVTLPETQY